MTDIERTVALDADKKDKRKLIAVLIVTGFFIGALLGVSLTVFAMDIATHPKTIPPDNAAPIPSYSMVPSPSSSSNSGQ
jgi:hypothetical protein